VGELPCCPGSGWVLHRWLHEHDDTAVAGVRICNFEATLLPVGIFRYTAAIMDVHAPHEPIHTFKDFLLHILTITIGLLIALGLEAVVENLHSRHLLHAAETNLHQELVENRKLLATDRKQIKTSEQSLSSNLALLTAIKAHKGTDVPPDFNWHWSGPLSASWDTARNTGAVALMSYDQAQGYSVIYGQQGYVNEQATVYIRDVYASSAAMQGGRTIGSLSPEEIDRMIAGTEQALVDLKLLDDLARSLDIIYNNASKEL